MHCPNCQQRLDRTKYSGANVHQCRQCGGHLVDKRRVKTIEKRIDKDHKSLVNEIAASTQVDQLDKFRCPRCKAPMKKSVPEDLGFHVDECMNCDATWFDGGELAKVQLAFETKSQTQQVNRMRDRLNSMTPAERAAYEKRIENLVDLGSPMGQAVTEATFELTWNYYFFGWR